MKKLRLHILSLLINEAKKLSQAQDKKLVKKLKTKLFPLHPGSRSRYYSTSLNTETNKMYTHTTQEPINPNFVYIHSHTDAHTQPP